MLDLFPTSITVNKRRWVLASLNVSRRMPGPNLERITYHAVFHRNTLARPLYEDICTDRAIFEHEEIGLPGTVDSVFDRTVLERGGWSCYLEVFGSAEGSKHA